MEIIYVEMMKYLNCISFERTFAAIGSITDECIKINL